MNFRRFFLLLLFAGIGWYLFHAVPLIRPFSTAPKHSGSPCRVLSGSGLVGAEDLETDERTQVTYIAAADRRGDPTFRPQQSNLLRLEPGGDKSPVPLQIVGMQAPLRVHGLSLYVGKDGERRLMTVQHGGDNGGGESVEIFRIEPNGTTVTHLRTVKSPLFVSLNDVAAIGPESFYVANDHGAGAGIGHNLEDFTFRKNASVVHFDGQSGRQVLGNLSFANGVWATHDGQFLLVAETLPRMVKNYRRAPDGALTLVGEKQFDNGVDNFSEDAQGAFYITGHKSPLRFLLHATDSTNRSPSEALRFLVRSDGQIEPPTVVWQDDGSTFSAASVAVRVGKILYVGAVFQDGLLMCPIGSS